MRIGSLNRRITIDQRTTARDAMGQAIETWTVFDAVAASMRPARGDERLQAGAEQAIADAVFRVHWRNDLDNTMRIRYAGDTYDILSIAELGIQEGTEIRARAKVD